MDAARSDGLYFLRRNPLFAPLGEDVLLEIARALKTYPLAKGATLVREGDPTDAMYVVKSGRVRIVSRSEKGEDSPVAYLGRGEAIGELSLITGEPHAYSILADTPCELLVLQKTDFDALLESHPLVGIHLSRALSKRLSVSFRPPVDKPKDPQLIALIAGLPHEAALLSIINLSIALVEQTRRKVLLLDMSARSGDIARALGLQVPMTREPSIGEDDLLDLDRLRALMTVHPAGLEILSLHPRIVREQWISALPALLGMLRDHYDFVLVITPVEKDLLSQIVWQQSDKRLLLLWDQARDIGDQSRAVVREVTEGLPDPLIVYLQDPSILSRTPADQRVPWSEAFHQPFRDTGTPYLVAEKAAPALAALERVARSLGKLRVGLAMGSGAAYGYSLIGMLKVFEREGIPIDMVSGTSMGALLGAFYCAGNSPDRIREIAHTINRRWLWENVFGDLTLPHAGFLAGQTLSAFLRSVLGALEFDQLLIPFASVATDIRTGHEVVLKEGRVVDAVRASTSLPIVFRPFEYKGRFLVDGGLVNPVPTSVVANMGANILISVNLTAKPALRRSLGRSRPFPLVPRTPGLMEVFFKTIYTMQYEIAQARTEIAHVVIAPDMQDFLWTDLHRSDEIIKVGEIAAEEAVSKLKSLLPFFSDYCKVPLGTRLRSY